MTRAASCFLFLKKLTIRPRIEIKNEGELLSDASGKSSVYLLPFGSDINSLTQLKTFVSNFDGCELKKNAKSKNFSVPFDFVKKTLVQVEEGKDEKTLNHYMHSAGIHTLNPDKNAAQSIPRQNYQQLQNASRFGLAYWCLFS